METNDQNPINETLLEGTKMAGKWVNDATASALEMYQKQLNLATAYYSNLFNSFWGGQRNVWAPLQAYTGMFSPNSHASFNPFMPIGSWKQNDDMFSQFGKMLREYNQQFFQSLTSRFETSGVDWKQINGQYQEIMEKESESFREITKTFNEMLTRQMDLSAETNKKLQEEVSRQLDRVFKLNQQFWLTTFERLVPGEEGHKVKETAESKKQIKKVELA